MSGGGYRSSEPPGAAGPLVAELQRYAEEVGAQSQRVDALLAGLSDEQVAWRPAEGKWSVGEHLAHLALTTNLYLEPLDPVVDAARAQGLLSPGPYRHGWIGRLFIRSMEPPVRLRIKTFRPLVPPRDVSRAAAVGEFRSSQGALLRSLRAANGVDLGRVTVRSPLVKALKLSVGQAFGAILAHNRRHFWQIEQIRRAAGLPAA